jgi:hypothetical protein
MAAEEAPELTLRWNEPLAVELTAAVQRGDAERLAKMLAKRPELARVWIVNHGEAAGLRSLLHLFADWPGHRRNPAGIVAVLAAAGADLDAGTKGGGAPETPLHWAASNDDVELVDALLDAGADIEAPGSVIGGLAPIADAAVFGGHRAGRRLVERGARSNIYQASALGLIDRVKAELATEPGPDADRITTAFWAACGAGHQEIAALLLAAGADIDWVGWGDQTPLDVAMCGEHEVVAEWLRSQGARSSP